MTGRPGLYGMDSVAAAEMAIDEVNAKGIAGGYKIDAVFTDSKAKPAYAVVIFLRFDFAPIPAHTFFRDS
jgi:branched-chain amino acid transport system substrate-binding protein